MTVRSYLLVLIIFVSFLSLGSYMMTRAYFSDTVTSATHKFAAAETFDTQQSDPEPILIEKVVINEVSMHGSASAEWVELYNPSDQDVNISGWKIADNSSEDTIVQGSIIPAKGYAIIVANNSIVNFPDGVVKFVLDSSAIGSGLNDTGGDAVILKNDGNIIDQMSYGEVQIISDPPQIPEKAQTLRRIPNGEDTNNGFDWQTGIPSIGAEN